MRNYISHTILGSATYGLAEYTHLAAVLAEWLGGTHAVVPEQAAALAIAVIAIVSLAHGVSFVGNALVLTGNALLASRKLFAHAWQNFLRIIERGILTAAGTALEKMRSWVEKALSEE